jgi:hypothetical protein
MLPPHISRGSFAQEFINHLDVLLFGVIVIAFCATPIARVLHHTTVLFKRNEAVSTTLVAFNADHESPREDLYFLKDERK